MRQAKATSAVGRFFKDKNGRWMIVQMPNPLLSTWIFLLLVNLVLRNPHIQLFQSAVLFTWSYLELTEGMSGFRKLLGLIVFVGVAVSFFVG